MFWVKEERHSINSYTLVRSIVASNKVFSPDVHDHHRRKFSECGVESGLFRHTVGILPELAADSYGVLKSLDVIRVWISNSSKGLRAYKHPIRQRLLYVYYFLPLCAVTRDHTLSQFGSLDRSSGEVILEAYERTNKRCCLIERTPDDLISPNLNARVADGVPGLIGSLGFIFVIPTECKRIMYMIDWAPPDFYFVNWRSWSGFCIIQLPQWRYLYRLPRCIYISTRSQGRKLRSLSLDTKHITYNTVCVRNPPQMQSSLGSEQDYRSNMTDLANGDHHERYTAEDQARYLYAKWNLLFRWDSKC